MDRECFFIELIKTTDKTPGDYQVFTIVFLLSTIFVKLTVGLKLNRCNEAFGLNLYFVQCDLAGRKIEN